MADLAKAVGMSRPALYQYFRNKEDIARSLTEVYFANAAGRVAQALQAKGTPAEVLEAAFRAKMGKLTGMIAGPHGEELMQLGHSVSGEVVEQGTARIVALFAMWLEKQRLTGAIHYEGASEDVARVMMNALNGIKVPPYKQFDRDLTILAQTLGRGLSV